MILNPHKSKFVIFEGIDGSGKSDQYARAQAFMKAYFSQVHVRYFKEPDKDRPIGKIIYEILSDQNDEYKLDKMRPYHMQAFYIEDRMANYRNNIIPALQAGEHVLQDRGKASSFCYGAQTSDEFYDFMGLHNRVFSAAQVPLIWPDLFLIFDVPASISVARMTKAGKKLDKFETENKLNLVRDNYLAFAKMYPNCVVVDGTPDQASVFSETKKHLLLTLGLDDPKGAK